MTWIENLAFSCVVRQSPISGPSSGEVIVCSLLQSAAPRDFSWPWCLGEGSFVTAASSFIHLWSYFHYIPCFSSVDHAILPQHQVCELPLPPTRYVRVRTHVCTQASSWQWLAWVALAKGRVAVILNAEHAGKGEAGACMRSTSFRKKSQELCVGVRPTRWEKGLLPWQVDLWTLAGVLALKCDFWGWVKHFKVFYFHMRVLFNLILRGFFLTDKCLGNLNKKGFVSACLKLTMCNAAYFCV